MADSAADEQAVAPAGEEAVAAAAGADDASAPERAPPAYSAIASPTSLLDERKQRPFDDESNAPKLKYPRSVFFIVSNEFCERFSYYGMRTILVLYLTSILGYHDDDATIIYHVFAMLCYFFPLLGSMIADNWLGKFRTIFYLSIVYAIGNVVIAFASSSGTINIPGRELTIVGLLLIAFGTGGIKPCVSAFGGDQFIIPQQEKQMAQFFSLFYFAINSGSLLSTFLTPVLREDVRCFDEDSCYPLAFGVPAALMIVSIIIFIIGKNLYIIKKPQGNIVVQVFKCIFHALGQKWSSKGQKKDHWLDYADDKYERKQIEDIKSALKVLYLYLPLPFFWALFDQQGSRWTFQATRMTGVLGGWSLKPDQMQVVNPLLILLFIPMFETCIYPVMKKCNLLTRPLQRLGAGGILAAVAFGISAIVEWQLEPTYAVLPKTGEGQIRIYNALNCDVTLKVNPPYPDIPEEGVIVKTLDQFVKQHWKVNSNVQSYTVSYSSCEGRSSSGNLQVSGKRASTYLIHTSGFNKIEYGDAKSDDVEKVQERARLRILYNNVAAEEITLGDDAGPFNITGTYGGSVLQNFIPDVKLDLKVDGKTIDTMKLNIGGVYTLLITGSAGSEVYKYEKLLTTKPNTLHMLWLIPQYVVMTMGEVMFSITGLEFSYSQSPLSMKSLMQAGWLLTVAFGNLIVIIIAEAKFFDRQLWEFILFAGLMVVDMIIFSLMAMGYTYIEVPHEGQDEIALENTKEKSGIDNKNFKTDDEH